MLGSVQSSTVQHSHTHTHIHRHTHTHTPPYKPGEGAFKESFLGRTEEKIALLHVGSTDHGWVLGWADCPHLCWTGHPTQGRHNRSPPPLGRRLRFRGPGGLFRTLVRAEGTQICVSVPSTASYLPLCWPPPVGVSCWWTNYRGGRQEKDGGQGPLRVAWDPRSILLGEKQVSRR